MIYGQIDGVMKHISRLVMGAQSEIAHATMMFDEYFHAGGNCFDTAHIYPNSDNVLGQWIANRGIREDVVILAKGAHSPDCYPANIALQLNESLESMGTDYADLYALHRDNTEVPVGEFIDALNELVAKGLIRAFGGSNWSCERVQAANDYAESKGLMGFRLVSNNLSLVRMVNPTCEGCIASSDPESREWYTRTQMPQFSWSPLARGIYARSREEDAADPIQVNSWHSDDNFKRIDRAKELAAKKNVLPVQIALAYLLHQPYPVYPIIGPGKLSSLAISLEALTIELTPDEVEWLNLEACDYIERVYALREA